LYLPFRQTSCFGSFDGHKIHAGHGRKNPGVVLPKVPDTNDSYPQGHI